MIFLKRQIMNTVDCCSNALLAKKQIKDAQTAVCNPSDDSDNHQFITSSAFTNVALAEVETGVMHLAVSSTAGLLKSTVAKHPGLPRSVAIQPSADPFIDGPSRPVSDQQRQLLACYLQLPEEITSKEEFNRRIKFSRWLSEAWVLQHTRAEVLKSVLTADLVSDYRLFLQDLPPAAITSALARECLKQNLGYLGWSYRNLPARLKTPSFNQFCLQIGALPVNIASDYLQSVQYSTLVATCPDTLKYVPLEHQNYPMCLEAIKKNPRLIEFVNPCATFYPELCSLAVQKSKFLCNSISESVADQLIDQLGITCLMCIPQSLRTYQRCVKAIRQTDLVKQFDYIPRQIFLEHPELANEVFHKQWSSLLLRQLPDSAKTEDFCQRYLDKWPGSISGCPPSLMSAHPEWVERAIRAGATDCSIPESFLTVDLYRRILRISPFNCSVPEKKFQDHPDLLFLAACSGSYSLKKIPAPLKTMDVCCLALEATDPYLKTIEHVPESLRHQLPYDLLLAVAPQYLPQDIRQAIVARGVTSLPLSCRQRGKPIMHQHILLEPLEPQPYDELKFSSSIFLQKALLSSAPFTLRNLAMGHALQQTIEQHCCQQKQRLDQAQLPVLTQPLSGNCTVYGGRALMTNTRTETSRMKFLRSGEPLEDFFREEAVHRFVWNHGLGGSLKSEVPWPVGLKLVPVELMPEDIFAGFRSRLETVALGSRCFYLMYQFTTRNQDYSTLAHQKDLYGNSTRAEQGLINASYDLGVWSSLGAVHTSTIQAYHSFKDNRRELFLCFMFDHGRAFPGALTAWDSEATDESDWGYSGLRDIGDMEFYPGITSYFDAADATAFMPPGFDQRAAFMNAFCENMVAAVLHYARMHRDDSDYHYKDAKGRAKLGAFIDQAIGAFLSGLVGRSVKTAEYFESPEIFQQWLEKTTAETTLWTARQNLNSDCFARSINENRCYPPEVYPDQKITPYRYQYPEDYTSNGQDNLGNNHGQFGLTLLIRGLYQVAAVLAVELGGGK